LRRNEAAHVEITALAAGAGPPAKRIATRRMFDCVWGGRDNGPVDMNELQTKGALRLL
jgi:hypothetical protein